MRIIAENIADEDERSHSRWRPVLLFGPGGARDALTFYAPATLRGRAVLDLLRGASGRVGIEALRAGRDSGHLCRELKKSMCGADLKRISPIFVGYVKKTERAFRVVTADAAGFLAARGRGKLAFRERRGMYFFDPAVCGEVKRPCFFCELFGRICSVSAQRKDGLWW